jgi:glycosyltransferase involved in cell wall biosynthesis
LIVVESENISAPGVPIYAYYHRPRYFGSHSGLSPLADAVGAHHVTHGIYWEWLAYYVWWLGNPLRRIGQRYYGSDWNAIVPVWDEIRFASRIKRSSASIAHFLFAEFAGPRWTQPFRRRGARIVGTFHTSPRRQESVIGRMNLQAYDQISVVSRTMIPFFVEHGYPVERIHVTLHGVDTDYFRPGDRPSDSGNKSINGLLVGATERDHEFAAAIMNKLPDGVMHLKVATRPILRPHYRDVRNTTILDHQNDPDLLKIYQEADVLLMPLLDATANNALLESMACGTPVLTNRVGGVPEYVDPSCNYVMEGKNIDEWIDVITNMAAHRDSLDGKRLAVRRWAEQLSWAAVAPQYYAMYRDALS